MTAKHEAQVVLITGGGTGIGRACAEAMAQRGWTVVIAGRRADVLGQTAKEIGDGHPEASVIAKPADVADTEQIAALVDGVVADHGQLDALVTAAAVYDAGPVTKLTPAEWDRTLDIVLRGSAFAAFRAAEHMRERGQGRIVLIASVVSTMSEFEQAPYNAAKAGVASVARSMAVELSESGVLVNAVSPGWVRTPMTEEGIAEIPIEVWRRICPMARPGEPDEIANLVRYLVTEAPPFLTGSSLVIDGAQTAMAAMP